MGCITLIDFADLRDEVRNIRNDAQVTLDDAHNELVWENDVTQEANMSHPSSPNIVELQELSASAGPATRPVQQLASSNKQPGQSSSQTLTITTALDSNEQALNNSSPTDNVRSVQTRRTFHSSDTDEIASPHRSPTIAVMDSEHLSRRTNHGLLQTLARANTIPATINRLVREAKKDPISSRSVQQCATFWVVFLWIFAPLYGFFTAWGLSTPYFVLGAIQLYITARSWNVSLRWFLEMRRLSRTQ